jgi:hypothetical protein
MATWSRLALCTAVAAGLVGVPEVSPPGDAHAAVKKKKKKKKPRKRVTKRAARKRGNNMPPGWTWPPSKEMTAEGKVCTDLLDTMGIGWKPAAATSKVNTPITLTTMELAGIKLVSTYRKAPHIMDCDLALGLASHLPALHDAGVRELHFSRIHDYTTVRVNGVEKSTLSRHALGLAIDIRLFIDADGRKAVVLDDYPKGDPLLLDVEQRLTDSGGFRTILTPRNDPQSHDDHFHLEVRVDYTAPLLGKPGS